MKDYNKSFTEYSYHKPVLLQETLEYLHIKNQGLYIDATLGAGGHTKEIIAQGGKVLGLDADPKMIEIATKNLSETCPEIVNANFSQIESTAKDVGFFPVDGVLMDLGISSVHFDDLQRGFSFKNPDAPLDMRLSDKQGLKASDLVNSLRVDQLTSLFELGMERYEAKRLAILIDRFKKQQNIETVGDFLLAGKFYLKKSQKINPATKAFMALRIAVNTELENLVEGLKGAFSILKPGGRLVVISFHSGEDRIVKNYFKEKDYSQTAKLLTKKPIKPTLDEIRQNPRARSAVLRAIEKK